MNRRSPIRRGKPLPRKPIRKRNPKRAARLFTEDFGSSEYVEHLHSMPCAVCDVWGWTVAAHLTSRGAGGKVDDLAPLCATRFAGTAQAVEGCHERYDARDPEVRQHEMRLRALARRLWSEWQTRGEE